MPEIPPGQEGLIEVKINTDGYGGSAIKEVVRVKTNDPERPLLEVTMTGLVEKFTEIRPERIRLIGPRGRPLAVEVEIRPRKEYPFTVLDIKAKNGEYIQYKLVETCDHDRNRCVIRVENTRTDKGRFWDAILVETDSELRPVIPIYVTGAIQ